MVVMQRRVQVRHFPFGGRVQYLQVELLSTGFRSTCVGVVAGTSLSKPPAGAS